MNMQEKLAERYTDLASNVTSIVGRSLLLRSIDLTYHSPLNFTFDGQPITRGGLDILIAGEPKCGKTASVERLMRHYQNGEMVAGECISQAGLVGGVASNNGMRYVKWGKIPHNDQGLIAIDEMSTLPHEVIASFSNLRSAGIAEVTKIESDRENARTRKIWISNPRFEKSFNDAAHPVEIIRNIVGRSEDIARFDIILGVRNDDVKPSDIYEARQIFIENKLTSQLCHAYVKYAWDNWRDEKVQFTKEAVRAVYDVAQYQIDSWATDFPMIVPSEQHEKVARLAAALAVILYAVTPAGDRLIVTEEHVNETRVFMDQLYNDKGLNYARYASVYQKRNKRTYDANEMILSAMRKLPYYSDVIRIAYSSDHITSAQIADEIPDIQTAQAKQVIAYLRQWGLISKNKIGYIKTQAFNHILQTEFLEELQHQDFTVKEVQNSF